MAMVVAGEGGGGGGGAEETAAKAVVKRYEGLVTVRNKAVKGKGAWYWAHLEPLMVHNHENGLPKAVKLKCCLCHTMFSASNPSRTASEHLKRGTCPHFSSAIAAGASPPPPPHAAVAGYPPPPAAAKLVHRKRSSSSSSTADGVAAQNNNNSENCDGGATSYDVAPISVVDPSRFSSEMGFSGGALVLHPNTNPNPSFQSLASPVGSSGGGGGGGGGGGRSGGGGGGMEVKKFEESVKKLKGGPPNEVVTGGSGTLSKAQIECALENLSDWVYESCGSVSFSSLEHPKFKSFLKQVGMVEVSKRDLVGSRLDSRFHEVKNECDSRIRDALFFQIASHGWNNRGKTSGGLEGSLVSVTVNLPNGASLFRRAVFTNGEVSDKFAEDVLWETIVDICGHSVHQCVGVVADKFKSTALKSMESQYGWMINLSCQCRALDSLIKDFYRELPLFRNVAQTCQKLANIVCNKTLRSCFHKYQLMDCGRVGGGGLFRVDGSLFQQESLNFEPVYGMIEDIMSSTGVLQSVLLDESYKAACMEDPVVREFGEIIRDVGFLNDLEAVRSLVRLVKETSHKFESERPLVGQCLPLWEELRAKVKEWCAKFHIADIIIEKVIERRFRKNYHPAWAAAYILDPFYMVRDTSGKYLPPFKYLTSEQQKDVHDLVTNLVSREEVPVAMSELMRWRSEGLDPVYAQAVQLKQRDTSTGKMRIANPQGSRLVWETYLPEFQSLGKVALRLIFLQATARGFNCNSALLNWVQSRGRSRSALDKAQKMIFISAHSKLERRDFTSEEDKDAELFGSANGEDDVLNEVYVDQ